MNLDRVGLGEDFATHGAVEGFLLRKGIVEFYLSEQLTYFGVRSLVNDSLSRCPEALTAF